MQAKFNSSRNHISPAMGVVKNPSSGQASAEKKTTLSTPIEKVVRSRWLFYVLIAVFVGLSGRVFYLQVVKQNFLEQRGEARYARTLNVPSVRGRIVDRNERVLASSIPAHAVWAIPEVLVQAPQKSRQQLAKALGLTESALNHMVQRSDNFVYLKRQVSPEVAREVTELAIDGVDLKPEFRRHYPEGVAASSLLGMTNIDDQGIEGLEKLLQTELAGSAGVRRVIKDLKGHIVEDMALIKPQKNGSNVQLTIDANLQYQLYIALKEAVDMHGAKSGSALLIDSRSGDVLALGNYPSFDPNDLSSTALKKARPYMRNRVFVDTYEPGSTMKAVTIASALDAGFVRADTLFNTSPGRITIDGRVINDTHNYGILSVAQIIEKSSNVGMSRVVMPIPSNDLYKSYRAFGFGELPSLSFPGAVVGNLRRSERWRPVEKATISYGHGVSVSLAQMAEAYTVFANDGLRVPMRLLMDGAVVPPKQVVKPSTARTVRSMLELAASKEGTGFAARIDGYRVAGKTGTTRKLQNGQYVSKYMSSFVGFAPASAPRFLMAVMIDEPTQNGYYGGIVAAPVFAKTMRYALQTYNIKPDAPRNQESPLSVQSNPNVSDSL